MKIGKIGEFTLHFLKKCAVENQRSSILIKFPPIFHFITDNKKGYFSTHPSSGSEFQYRRVGVCPPEELVIKNVKKWRVSGVKHAKSDHFWFFWALIIPLFLRFVLFWFFGACTPKYRKKKRENNGMINHRKNRKWYIFTISTPHFFIVCFSG